MKIICVGRNYTQHARELDNPVPEEPVLFLKPDTALLRKKEPFYYPDFSQEIHYEAEIVLKIGKQGKNIDEQYAGRYIESYTVGIDFTARDLQNKLKKQGLPWEKAKAFDRSAAIGQWLEYDHGKSRNIDFSLKKNNEMVQQGNTGNLIFPFEKLIAFASSFFTLKTGDLIFTGTPEGVGEIKKKDFLVGYAGTQKILELSVK